MLLEKMLNLRATSTFEREFAQEIVTIERQRSILLAAIFGIGTLLFLPGMLLFHQQISSMFGYVHVAWFAVLTFVLGFVYELCVVYVLGVYQRTKRPLPDLPRYVNAAIETSIPTIFIVLATLASRSFNDFQANLTMLYVVLILLSAMRLSLRLCLWTGFVAAVGYMFAWWFWGRWYVAPDLPSFLLHGLHLERAVMLQSLGFVAGFLAMQIRQRAERTAQTLAERNRIANMFGQHVSPEVMEQLLSQKQDQVSELRFVCVMFLDIRSFTSYAEQTSPHLVISYLNTVFDSAIAVINQHNGIVNKFLGDGLMAVFGAPVSDDQACANAVAASQEIVRKINELVANEQIPPTRIGIGLHAGDAITGTIGSEQRQEYTIIGDVVNVAARIEQLNKELKSQVLISEVVWQGLNGSAPADVEMLPNHMLRGRQTPITLIKLM